MKKYLSWALLALLAIATSQALAVTVYRYDGDVVNIRGDVIGGAYVTVYEANTTTLASLYSTPTASTTKGNPCRTDVFGRYYFYAAPGVYDLVFSGSGITSYTLEDVSVAPYDVMEGYYPVSRYGAVGDGTTDDTTAIQAAVTAASSDSCGVVQLIPGESYWYDETIDIPSGVSIQSTLPYRQQTSSWNSSLKYAGTDCAIKLDNHVSGKNSHHNALRDIQIEYVGPDSIVVNGIETDYATFLIDNVRVLNFTGHGMDIGQSIFSTIRASQVSYSDSSGIYIHSSDVAFPNGQIVLENCTSTHSGQNALKLENVLGLEVVGGTYALADSQQILMEGCIAIGIRGAIIEPQTALLRTYDDNLVEVGSAHLSSLIKSKDIVIENCNFDSGQAGATSQFDWGLRIDDGTDNVRVSNCQFVDFDSTAVIVDYTESNTTTGIVIGENTYYTTTAVDIDDAQGSIQWFDLSLPGYRYVSQYVAPDGLYLVATAEPDTAGMRGLLWFDGENSALKFYDGSSWVTLAP